MRALLIPLALAGLCQAAHADGISSAYTDLDWKKEQNWIKVDRGVPLKGQFVRRPKS